MCTIISIKGDRTTDDVIDWIWYLNGKYSRINITNDIEEKPLFLSLSNQKHTKENSTREKGWVRKTGFFKDLNCYKELLNKESFTFTNYIYSEFIGLRKFFFDERIEWINDPNTFSISKTEILRKAIQYDINVPETFIINRKTDLQKLFNKFNGEIIIKSITDVIMVDKNGNSYASYTYKIKQEDISQLPDRFFPTQIQSYVEKEFEIRSFYFQNQFFSAAIFSQNDEKTKIDFRKYNYEKPNRLIPYKLPNSLEIQLNNLFNDIGITTGSLDIIKGIDGKFYFLEINQGGQFGMISIPCNFNIEKLIAKSLTE